MSNSTIGFIYCIKRLEEKNYCVLAIQVVFQDGSVFMTISFIKISSLLDLSLAHLAKDKVNFCPDLASVVC